MLLPKAKEAVVDPLSHAMGSRILDGPAAATCFSELGHGKLPIYSNRGRWNREARLRGKRQPKLQRIVEVVCSNRYAFPEIEITFNAPADRPCKMWHARQTETEEIVLDTCNQYTRQGDVFSRAILDNTEVPTPISDAVVNMKVIEVIVRSGTSGAWETV